MRSEPSPPWPWPAWTFATIAAIAAAFGLVGLARGGLWVDELFTLQVVAHAQSWADLLRRILLDVHPPLYDLLLYGWTRLGGLSESALRLPSAVSAILALVVFALVARRVAGATAVAFACAAAATSMFWYEQAQNARNYALCLLLAAILPGVALWLRRRVLRDEGFPYLPWIALTALGIAASQAHSYLLLAVGMLYGYLLLRLPGWRVKLAIIVSGVLTLALYLGFLLVMLHSAEHDFAQTWFRADAGFLASHTRRALLRGISRPAWLVVLALLLGWWLRRRGLVGGSAPAAVSDEAAWLSGLCGCVLLGVWCGGIAICWLATPSFSDRNLLTCAPFGWLLLARLYDRAGPRGRSLHGVLATLIFVLLLALPLLTLRGRWLPTTEPWRPTAHYVDDIAACQGQPLPALVEPDSYGSLSGATRLLVERDYYGHYLDDAATVRAFFPDALLAELRAHPAALSSTCPLLAWTVHRFHESDALAFAQRLSMLTGKPQPIRVQELLSYRLDGLHWSGEPGGFVFLRDARAGDPALPGVVDQGGRVSRLARGDLLLLTPLVGETGSHIRYRLQRWGVDGSAHGAAVVIDATTASPP